MVSERNRCIAVAGNMGVGKSTLVQFLSAQFDGKAFYEPVDSNPYFAKFFKDMRTWAFHSQMYFLTYKFRIHQEAERTPGLTVIDRSIYEDAEIFVKGLFRSRKLSKDEFKIYWDLYDAIRNTLRPPDVLIYLTCSMKTLTERVNSRGRQAEKSVPESYLRRLQKNYDQWVRSIDFCDVITINTDNLDYTSDALHRARVIEHLSKYLVDP
jgi:deoxyadenosine/deoxycytidine kinase